MSQSRDDRQLRQGQRLTPSESPSLGHGVIIRRRRYLLRIGVLSVDALTPNSHLDEDTGDEIGSQNDQRSADSIIRNAVRGCLTRVRHTRWGGHGSTDEHKVEGDPRGLHKTVSGRPEGARFSRGSPANCLSTPTYSRESIFRLPMKATPISSPCRRRDRACVRRSMVASPFGFG